MNIVVITNCARPELLEQTARSIADSSGRHHITVVIDKHQDKLDNIGFNGPDAVIVLKAAGTSAARNIGAASIPKYRREQSVMLCDDDVYFCPGWDDKIEEAMRHYGDAVISGHAHPFNKPINAYKFVHSASVLSATHMVMPWALWDDIGYFLEPGGPASSDDVEWCARATKKGYGLAVTNPQVAIHCGLTSSNGQPLVGAAEVRANNHRIELIHGIVGKVHYS